MTADEIQNDISKVALKYKAQLAGMASILMTVPEGDRTDVFGAFFSYLLADPEVLGNAGPDSLYRKHTDEFDKINTDGRFIV